ncbi:Lipopolysaccharide biosynthesis protein wzxC [Cedecea neteri]|uniref:Lipopolysaccharide biosynthesis protein wzxC n=1 Tax=Cedecea neteri TaxID=158822 RepID=A0A2X3IXW8_9ENTR|nr:Lipopolysaccharide biosynthesis protein wzxC [Cedecea neteri]
MNFYKLLSIVGIINFPALLGLMVVSNNFVPLVFGEKWQFITPILQLLCVVGLLRSIGNPIGSLLMAKARVDISFKFNVFKTCLFIPAIIVGGQVGGALGVTLGFLFVQVVNTVLSYFIMIKPVLGSSYRNTSSASGCLFICRSHADCQRRAWHGAERSSAAGGHAWRAGSGRGCGFYCDDYFVPQCAGC